MGEYTQKFPLGAWVTGTTTDGNAIEVGYVSAFDEGDGQHYVRGVLPSLGENEKDAYDGWAEPDELVEVERPDWIAPSGPSHAFIYEWMDDHVPNVTLHAEPNDIITAYFSDATEDERQSLTVKLMEAVMDPGERVELVPGGGAVRFCVVNG